jgi:serpin B
VAATSLAASCVGSNSGGQEVRADVPAAPADPDAVPDGVLAVNAFGVDLYRVVAPGRANVVIAPYPIALTLGQARTGAAGDTLAQLDTVLHADLAADLDLSLRSVDESLDALGGQRSNELRRGDIDISVVDALWAQRGTNFSQQWLDTLATNYDTGVRVADFRSDPEAARRAVNEWVASQSGDEVRELVPKGTVTQLTRMSATSAMVVQAPWAVRFDEQRTRLAPFTLSSGQTVDTSMLQLLDRGAVRYAERDAWRAVELPYLGDELTMLVIVPTGDLASFEQALTPEVLRDIDGQLRSATIDLRLPAFSFTTNLSLNDPLRALGATAAFDLDAADFSGITSDEPLVLSETPFETYVAVDEEGTGATAATVTPSEEPTLVGPRRVVVDQPFLFAVRDTSTGLILLLGRVADPTQ